MRKFSTLLRPLAAFAVLYLAVSMLLRLVLWWQFGRDADVSPGSAAAAVLAGFANDAIELIYLLVLFTTYVVLLPRRWHSSKAGTVLMFFVFGAVCFGLFYLNAVEYYFFEEFNARLNLVAFDYLMYPTEVIGDIKDAYPVGTVMVIAVVLAIATTYVARNWLLAARSIGLPFKQRVPVLITHLTVLALAIAFVPTSLLALSQNRVTNEIAINGISSFFQAARTSEIDYYAYYRSETPQAAFQRLTQELQKGGGEFTALDRAQITRSFAAKPNGLGKLNIIVVSEESLGAEFSAAYGAEQTDTPELDALSKQSLMFSNAYASGTRTVRGLEAITASFPPIPSVSILRRPGNENIATWGSVMRTLGYHTSFLYGGYGYFDNMNYFYGNNGFEVIDRTQIEHPIFENIWGVSDEDLFRKALEHFDARHATGEPFFSIVMTTSNHKPFTFRDGVPGVPPQGGGRHAGVRYADFALGKFIKEAASHPWFDNTLFVLVADHGARVYGKTEIPLRTYRIPLLLFAPKHIPPRVVDTLMGQIDIAPTVLGLLGVPYDAPFFGQDVISNPSTERIALFNHNHDVAVYRDGKLAVLGLNKKLQTLRYDAAADSYTPIPEDPDLTALAIAYYQTAYDLFRQKKYK